MSGASRYWPARQPFDDALDARTPRPVVTLAIVALNVGIFMSMVMGAERRGTRRVVLSFGAAAEPR